MALDAGVTPRDAAAIGTPDAGAPPPGMTSAGVQQLCVDTINKYRATLNLAPYARGTAANESCADMEAQSDSMTGKAHGAFGKCGERAQNECPGWPGKDADALVKCLQQMWNEGPPGSSGGQHGHYVNMTNTSYKTAFCGFYKTASGSWWMVQDFR